MDIDVRSAIRSIIVALVSIGLVVLVVVLLIKGFSGKPSSPSSNINVGKYAYNSAIATLLIDAPTNINQDHYQVRISVSGTENELDVIQGYEGNVIRSQTYSNNTAAFGVFLQSLQLMNFSHGSKATTDYRGYCPTGNRYLYGFSDGQNELFSYWSTSCGSQGTFEGNAPGVRSLFERQIPSADLNKLTAGTSLAF